MKKDRFKITVRLRHPSLDPSEISRELGLKPTLSSKVGSRVGKIVHKWSFWYGLLAEGAGVRKYESALKKAVLFLESRQEWLNNVFNSEGELNVIFNFWTELDEGKICEVNFYPELLLRLSKLNAGIQFEVWKEENKEGVSK